MFLPAPRKVFLYREQSDALNQLFEALATARPLFKPVVKNRVAQYGAFADLLSMTNATADALAACGLVVNQTFQPTEGDLMLVTELGHKSGQFIRSVFPIKLGAKPTDTLGTVTYYRRCCYAAILGLAAEDDDDGTTADNSAATQATVNWKQQEQLAKDALSSATTLDRVADITNKVRDRITKGDLDPHFLGVFELLAKQKITDLSKAADAAKAQAAVKKADAEKTAAVASVKGAPK
jgi:hypothetical protein